MPYRGGGGQVGGGVAWGTSVIYVDAGAPVPGQTGTALHPFVTIQAGLNATVPGGTVLVASGIYIESINWPSRDNITLEGIGNVIVSAPGGDTLTFSPGAGITIDRMTIRNVTLQNAIFGGRALVLDGNGTSVGGIAQFLRVLGLFERVLLEKSSTGDAAYIRAASVVDVLDAVGTSYNLEIMGWTGRTQILNCGHVAFRSCQLGLRAGQSLSYSYDYTLPVRPYGGRQGVYLVESTVCYGTIVLVKTPMFVVDLTCALLGDISDSGLTSYAAATSAPVIVLGCLVGSLAIAVSIVLSLPSMGATTVTLVDLSGATIYSSTAKPLNISTLGAGIARNCVRAHLSRFEGTTVSSVVAGQYTDIDLRGSHFNQAALASTGAGATVGGFDRNSHQVACIIPGAPYIVSPVISPPLPPVSAIWYPMGAPYTVRYELDLPSTLPGTSAKTNTGFTATGTAAVTAIAVVARDS